MNVGSAHECATRFSKDPISSEGQETATAPRASGFMYCNSVSEFVPACRCHGTADYQQVWSVRLLRRNAASFVVSARVHGFAREFMRSNAQFALPLHTPR